MDRMEVKALYVIMEFVTCYLSKDSDQLTPIVLHNNSKVIGMIARLVNHTSNGVSIPHTSPAPHTAGLSPAPVVWCCTMLHSLLISHTNGLISKAIFFFMLYHCVSCDAWVSLRVDPVCCLEYVIRDDAIFHCILLVWLYCTRLFSFTLTICCTHLSLLFQLIFLLHFYFLSLWCLRVLSSVRTHRSTCVVLYANNNSLCVAVMLFQDTFQLNSCYRIGSMYEYL